MLSEEEDRILSAAFVAHIGKGFSKERIARPRPKPLTDELDEIASEHPELKRLLAIRLWKMALLGRGKHALEAMRILFERMEGPVVKDIQREQPQSVEVVVQQINHHPAPQIEQRPPFDIPSDEAFAEQVHEGKLVLQREVRPLPQPTDILRGLDPDGRA